MRCPKRERVRSSDSLDRVSLAASPPALRHTNFVQIHEVGEHDGRPFLALESIESGTLADSLAGAPVTPRRAAAFVEQIARRGRGAPGGDRAPSEEIFWHPVKDLLAVAVRDYKVHLWDVVDRKEVMVLEGFRHGGVVGAFNHKGDVFVTMEWYGTTRFWDPGTGRQLLKAPEPYGLSFAEDDRTLATHRKGDDPHRLHLAELADRRCFRGFVRDPSTAPGVYQGCAFSPHLPILVAAMTERPSPGVIDRSRSSGIVTGRASISVRLTPHDDARYVDVTPDGKWVATGGHGTGQVKVWSPDSGRLVKEFPKEIKEPAFSPDGRWLSTSGDRARLWKVGTWEEKPLPMGEFGPYGVFRFSPDSRLMSALMGDRAVRLLEVATGRKVARLQGPSREILRSIRFSPDSTLLAGTADFQSIHVWDLRAVRRELAAIDLDWDFPPFPPESAPAMGSLKTEIVAD